MSTRIEIFLSLLEELSAQAIKHLKQKVLHERGDLVLLDSQEYQKDLIFTILRSILLPFFSLTKWIEKTSSERIYRELDFLCSQLIIKYNAGTLIDDVKSMCVEMLTYNLFSSTKAFLSGSLLKQLKLMKFNSTSRNKDVKLKSLNFFYSMNQLKVGVAQLPVQDVLDKILKFKEEISGTPDNNINNISLFFLKFASQLIFNKPHKIFDETEVPNVLPEGATYRDARSKLAWKVRNEGSSYPVSEQHSYFKNLVHSYQLPTVENKARMVVLMEPLKLRMLTIAETAYQLGTRYLQSEMLNYWKSSPYSTMKDGSLDQFISKFRKDESTEFFYSVDYSDASNKIKSVATKIVVNEFMDYHRCSAEYKKYISASVSGRNLDLTETLVLLPRGESKPITDIFKNADKMFETYLYKQRKGQMMGNTLSFPILCVINLATFLQLHYENDADFKESYNIWKDRNIQGMDFNEFETDKFWEWRDATTQNYVAFRWESLIQKFLRKKDIKILINGDDGIDLTAKAGMDVRHKQIASNYGLVINPMKTLFTNEVCNMNSRQFLYLEEGFQEVGYLNQRLLLDHNVKKASKLDSSGEVSLYAARYNKYIHLCAPKSMEDLYDRAAEFEILNMNQLKAENCLYPCLSTNVGGSGLDDVYCVEPSKIARDRILDFILPNLQKMIGKTKVYGTNYKDSRPRTRFSITGFSYKTATDRYFNDASVTEGLPLSRYQWKSERVLKTSSKGRFDLSHLIVKVLWNELPFRHLEPDRYLSKIRTIDPRMTDYDRSSVLGDISMIAILDNVINLNIQLTPYRINEKSINLRVAVSNMLAHVSNEFLVSHPTLNTIFITEYTHKICFVEKKMNKSTWSHIFRPDFESQSSRNKDFFFMSDECGWFISPMDFYKNLNSITTLFDIVFGDAQTK